MNDNSIETKNTEMEETLSRLDSEIEKTPNDVGLYRIKVALFLEEGRVDEALEHMNMILKIDPNDTKTLQDKGEILCKRELYKEALDCYNKAVEIDSELTKAWLGRGIALMKLRTFELEDDLEILDKERRVHLEDAMDSLTVVTDRNPKSLIAWNGRGSVLYMLHRYEEAIDCYDKCNRINPDFIKGWFGRGKVLRMLNRNEEAKEAFERVIGCINKNSIIKDIETLLCEAKSYVELGQENEAIDCINQFLAKDPHNHLALACKGDILEKVNRKAEALECYKKSVELDPTRVYVWHRLGNLKAESGEYESALEYYNEAVQLISGFEEAWFKIGQILNAENKQEQAKECFSWVLEINPDNTRAQDAIARFKDRTGLWKSRSKKEKRKSKGRKSRKKRKKRKRKKKKVEEYQYVPEEELMPQADQCAEDTQVYYEEVPEVSFPQNQVEEEIDSYMQLLESKAQGEPILESNEESLEIMNELEELAEESEDFGEVPQSNFEQSEIDSEIAHLENEITETEGQIESLDDNINELKELMDDTPGKTIQGEQGQFSPNEFADNPPQQENELNEAGEPNEQDVESYGDLGSNLDELEQLLIEKSDYIEKSTSKDMDAESMDPNDLEVEDLGSLGVELSVEDHQSEENENGEDPQMEPLQEEGHGLEDLESSIEELQELDVSESAHLDGGTIGKKLLSENHLDGHKIEVGSKSLHLDAHNEDFEKQRELKQSLDTLVNKGKMHMKKGELQQAMTCFDKALELDPQCIDAWGAKGDLLIEMDEEEQ